MELSDAATFFDRTPCYDAYTGDYVFDTQLGLYDDNRRDSETSERRTLSVGAGTVLPLRRVVQAAGYNFIIGKGNPDTFFGDVIRIGYVGHEASNVAKIQTLGQVCLDVAGVTAYAGSAWLKNAAFTEQSSRFAPTFHMFFASSEQLSVNQVVTFNGRLHVVRSFNIGASGLLIALVEELDAQVEAALISTGYDPIAGTEVTTTTAVDVLRVRWQSLFTYGQKSAPSFGPDDVQIAMALTSFTPIPGDRVTLADSKWRIASVQSEGDAWVCRATRNV